MKTFTWTLVLCAAMAVLSHPLFAEYAATPHRDVRPGEVPVGGPGVYAQPNTTYVLTADVSSATSPVFLGKDVTLDLNGYTLTYAAGGYEHVPNYGFEEGTKHWDLTGAPGAKVEDTAKVKPFIGEKILSLPVGEEIVSPYVNLPVADRAYYGMCGVLSQKMQVHISIEAEGGRPVTCEFKWQDKVRQTCPQTCAPRLGGGVTFALMYGQAAGRYRIRVKNTGDRVCLIDQVDIRPAMDVGVSIIEKTYPWAYHRCVWSGDACAFFDYTEPGTYSTPRDGLPKVSGTGTITIRNGVIRSGFRGIRSWGIQSTAAGVTLRVENVKVVAAGINTNALSHRGRGIVKDCRFEIDTPFIINRHSVSDSPVSISGADSDVMHCQFIGGQGCLHIVGDKSRVHDNLFVNRQRVTNHYSVGLGSARGTRVYRNRFEPEIGSGILMGRAKDCEVYENTFKIMTANGNCEYTNEDYSTNAIRITDYNAKKRERGAHGNRIHHNRFEITGRHYTNYKGFMGVATAVFVSVGGGVNHVYENEIVVNHTAPDSPSLACAFYLGGSRQAGEFYRNKITSNVPAVWCGTFYGNTSNAKICENTLIKADDAPAGFTPYQFGVKGRNAKATDIEFRDNTYVNCEFGIRKCGDGHSHTRSGKSAR
ncbi:MAG: hypothetical protein JXR37_32010 [Kiritimatiellae bacterium]|nr:hypothetical protein [Kiritimatiellia bacterium]